ncbi:MAG: hypothetical protein HYR63_06020 [Proteobacteria bacterium]|nr:hypothetical protein [Pseudomonadota bacterium]MBI3505657.1 hypothetical protein [Pseudomonadota bacterium]
MRSINLRSIALSTCLALLSGVAIAQSWQWTGGPAGGQAYDLRIRPSDPNQVYATDVFSGVARSFNAGANWTASNSGISVKSGPTQDWVSIFSITIDPNNDNTLWTGTQAEAPKFGIFKSTDGGQTWNLKVNGIPALSAPLSYAFRGFTVQPGNSNVVYAQAEIHDGIRNGKFFALVKGRIFKSTNGGDSWTQIWEGDNLARHLIIDPTNSNVLYASTGIFDREANNSNCAVAGGAAGGVGVLKSTDGGQTWNAINTGITDLYVGFLRMHPTNSQILFAAAGNNACSAPSTTGDGEGGVFRTTNGGATWTKLLGGNIYGAVVISPVNTNLMFAAGTGVFQRSTDGGATWTKLASGTNTTWGPPGFFGGFPIDLTPGLSDANLLYASIYGIGTIVSTDAGVSWKLWSKGYTGAFIQQVRVSSQDPNRVYANGRAGPYVSYNRGGDWVGLSNSLGTLEWASIAVDPTDQSVILIADDKDNWIFRSTNAGSSYTQVLGARSSMIADPNQQQGMHALEFAPGGVVYAGVSIPRTTQRTSTTGPVIYKSTDRGQTFTGVASIMDGKSINALAIDPSSANRVFAGTSNGVYGSTDGAATWSLLGLSGHFIQSLTMDPRDSNSLIAGENPGGVWISSDGGRTWVGPYTMGFNSATPQIRAVVFDPNTANTLYSADLYGGVYKALDGGKTWAAFPDSAMTGLTVRTVNNLAISRNDLYASTEGGGVYRYGFTASPTTVAAQSGWWWNSGESGRGFGIELSGNNLFLGAYLYDANGAAIWYITSGAMSSGTSYTGTLDQYGNGQTLSGSYKGASKLASLGAISLTFTSDSEGTITWPGGTIFISRYDIVSNGVVNGASASAPQSGWWWNAAEGGRGYFLEVQGTKLFLAGYMYETTGRAVWYVSLGDLVTGAGGTSTFTGTLTEYAGGQSLTGAYQPPNTSTSRGQISIQFSSATQGTLTLPNGTSTAITRYRF